MTREYILDLLGLGRTWYSLFPADHAALYDFLMARSFPSGNPFVELGVCYGRTSILLAAIAQDKAVEYHGVDLFVLSTEAEYRQTMTLAGLPYHLHVGLTTAVGGGSAPATATEVPWNCPISFLLIDASHTEPWFSADCIKWLPFVEPGGVVAFDDWPKSSSSEDPHWAVAHFGELHTNDWEDLGWVGRLRVKRKPLRTP